MKLKALFILCLLSVVTPSHAQKPAQQSMMPEAMQSLGGYLNAKAPEFKGQRHKGLDIFEAAGGQIEYLGNRLGLDAWAIYDNNDNVQMAYTTPQGALISPGYMFNEKAEPVVFTLKTKAEREAEEKNTPSAEKTTNAEPASAEAKTAEDTKAQSPAKPSSKAEQVYALTETTSYITFGDAAAPYIYVFVNPTCDHCHLYWQSLKAYVDKGQLQVRLIPYGRITQNANAAALMLSNPEKAKELWEKASAGDKNAFANDGVVDPLFVAKATKNTKIAMDDINVSTVPFTIYRANDNAIKVLPGQPRNIMLMLSDIIR